jgi:hypothetical protein
MTNPGQDPVDSDASLSSNSHDVYEIRIKGLLDGHWRRWFEGMTLVTAEEDGQDCTVLIGAIADQPALHGLLERIRDLNLTLLSVRKIAASEPASKAH